MNILTDENFKKEILNSQKPVLVDFWASWCAPCGALGPILERVASDFGDRVIFTKVNIDEAPATAQEFNIDRIPNVILFKDGKPVNSFVGVRPEEEIKKWLEDFLGGKNEEADKLTKEYEEYAKSNNFSLNLDKKIVENIVKALLDREKKLGARYCPCRRVTGDKEEDKKIICPCIYHKDEIEKDGHCHCNLFAK